MLLKDGGLLLSDHSASITENVKYLTDLKEYPLSLVIKGKSEFEILFVYALILFIVLL